MNITVNDIIEYDLPQAWEAYKLYMDEDRNKTKNYLKIRYGIKIIGLDIYDILNLDKEGLKRIFIKPKSGRVIYKKTNIKNGRLLHRNRTKIITDEKSINRNDTRGRNDKIKKNTNTSRNGG